MTLIMAALVAVAMNAGGGVASPGAPLVRPALLAGVAQDAAITRAFRVVLSRDPSSFELRRYRMLMDANGWSEYDVRRDLRERSDYRSVRTLRGVNADDIIRRAYQEILGREPDPAGLRTYRRNILEEGWDEQDVRQALIRSPERRQKLLGPNAAQASEMVRNAYRSVLGREPDPNGMSHYTARILVERWTEEDVAQALRESDEYREKHP